jgi:hypothetical protein
MCAKRFRGNVMNATAGASAIQARAMSAANEHVPSVQRRSKPVNSRWRAKCSRPREVHTMDYLALPAHIVRITAND